MNECFILMLYKNAFSRMNFVFGIDFSSTMRYNNIYLSSRNRHTAVLMIGGHYGC